MQRISYDDAAHLLRRMAFGGSPAEINALASRTREEAVDSLLNFDSIDNQDLENYLRKNLNPKKFTPQDDLQIWWMTRLIMTARPFEEKMTLFWHNHFATALDKVPYGTMYVQNQMLRANSLERFDTLLLYVAQDPAMLVYLDGVTNVLGNPNENFARELQELFTMGIRDVVTGQPNYTEKDVKEIARAFTGWKYKEKEGKPYRYTFYIDQSEHDNGAKEVYGRTVNYTGEDIVQLLSAHRSTGRFLVKKLFEFFVYPLGDSAEDKATIERFADVYFSSNHSIRSLARAIFVSDEFFSNRARFALVKSPFELIVGSMRMLSADYYAGNLKAGTDYEMYQQFKRMGFDLLNPFDVSGWRLNLGWLGTATQLERYNFINHLLSNRDYDPKSRGAKVTTEHLKKYVDASAAKTVQNFLYLLGPLTVDAAVAQTLIDYLQTDEAGMPYPFTVNDEVVDKLVRGLVYLIMTLPEYQMN